MTSSNKRGWPKQRSNTVAAITQGIIFHRGTAPVVGPGVNETKRLKQQQ